MNFRQFFYEADRMGRAYRGAVRFKGKESKKEYYDYIKQAQKKAEDKAKVGEVKIYHMILPSRVAMAGKNIMDALEYIFSRRDVEISVSVDRPIWNVDNAIVLIGRVSDMYEYYDVDSYTETGEKERMAQEIRDRNDSKLHWDEGIVNLRDVVWDSVYIGEQIGISWPEHQKLNSYLHRKENSEGDTIGIISDKEDFLDSYSSEEQLNTLDKFENLRDLSSDLYDLVKRVNRWYSRWVFDKYPPLDGIVSSLQQNNYIYDEDARTMLQFACEVDDHTDLSLLDMNANLDEEILSTKQEINRFLLLQTNIWEVYCDILESIGEEELPEYELERMVCNVTNNGHIAELYV